jgi:hypothetical protein
MVEAAILGKPVLSLMTGEFAATQQGTLHFHYLLPENGGFLRVARSLDEHVVQLTSALHNPDVSRAETQSFVRSFLRPRGLDVPARRCWRMPSSVRRICLVLCCANR